ncbi:hypothetical protein EDB86DRAFT_2825789 [Lactarius hatsudake]|nr:hypothetical protein EDB86DRAFT_2825789 [Lactarius hatsudake]
MVGSFATRRDVYLRGFLSPELGQPSCITKGLFRHQQLPMFVVFHWAKEICTSSEERPVSSTTYRTTKAGEPLRSYVDNRREHSRQRKPRSSCVLVQMEGPGEVLGGSNTVWGVGWEIKNDTSNMTMDTYSRGLIRQHVDCFLGAGRRHGRLRQARDSFRELQLPRKLRSYECSFEAWRINSEGSYAEDRLINEAAARKNPFKISMTSSAAILLLVAQENPEQGMYLSLGKTRLAAWLAGDRDNPSTRRQREVVIASHVKFVIKPSSVT